MVKELYEFAWHDISDVQIVAEYPEVSSTELYVSASLWMVGTFKSSDSVLELEDKDAGILKGKFTLTAPQFLGTIYFDNIVTIEVKDGKARLTILAPISIYYYSNYGKKTNVQLTQSTLDVFYEDREIQQSQALACQCHKKRATGKFYLAPPYKESHWAICTE